MWSAIPSGIHIHEDDNQDVYTSAPMSKYLEMNMAWMDQLATEHDWVTYDSGNALITGQGFDWYRYIPNKESFNPNWDAPYNLTGTSLNVREFWDNYRNCVGFINERMLLEDSGDKSLTSKNTSQHHLLDWNTASVNEIGIFGKIKRQTFWDFIPSGYLVAEPFHYPYTASKLALHSTGITFNSGQSYATGIYALSKAYDTWVSQNYTIGGDFVQACAHRWRVQRNQSPSFNVVAQLFTQFSFALFPLSRTVLGGVGTTGLNNNFAVRAITGIVSGVLAGTYINRKEELNKIVSSPFYLNYTYDDILKIDYGFIEETGLYINYQARVGQDDPFYERKRGLFESAPPGEANIPTKIANDIKNGNSTNILTIDLTEPTGGIPSTYTGDWMPHLSGIALTSNFTHDADNRNFSTALNSLFTVEPTGNNNLLYLAMYIDPIEPEGPAPITLRTGHPVTDSWYQGVASGAYCLPRPFDENFHVTISGLPKFETRSGGYTASATSRIYYDSDIYHWI